MISNFIFTQAAIGKGIPEELYIGEIQFQNPNGVFRLEVTKPTYILEERENYFRLWGVSVSDIDAVTEVTNGEFQCSVKGVVSSAYTGKLLIVDCNEDGVSLAQSLISSGLATEVCAETGGKFGSCPSTK